MSTDRLERSLPQVLTELALPRVPAYVDDLLSRTERMPQRAGWTFPERWFPVSTFTATLSMRRPSSLRPLVAAAIILVLALAALALYVGTQRHLPPLYGLARNGALLTTDSSGNIVSVDPSTGTSHTLIKGPGLCCARFSPDGQHILYFHYSSPDTDPDKLTIANLDGSKVRVLPADLLAGQNGGWVEWAPTDDRLLLSDLSTARIVEVTTGAVTQVNVPFRVNRASWIGSTGDILLTSMVSTTVTRMYRLAAGTTSDAKQLAEIQYMVAYPQVSPDGSRVLFYIWGPEGRLHGDLHVFDLATGTVTPLTEEAFDDGNAWENPTWSPDGSKIAAELYQPNGEFRIAVIPAAGGDPVLVGPAKPEGTSGAAIRFSPDGQSLLVTYRFDNTTWLLPVSGSPGKQLSWTTTEDLDWQRLGQ